jgi:NADH-quinone oxidoreductase subunit E
VISAVAERLGDSPAFVDGVVSFYTMYHTSPPARYVLQVCTTLWCSVCGGRELVEHLKAKLGVGFGEKTPDGSFQLVGVQCLGACGNAPVIQVNDDYYENLTPQRLDAMLDELREGR